MSHWWGDKAGKAAAKLLLDDDDISVKLLDSKRELEPRSDDGKSDWISAWTLAERFINCLGFWLNFHG